MRGALQLPGRRHCVDTRLLNAAAVLCPTAMYSARRPPQRAAVAVRADSSGGLGGFFKRDSSKEDEVRRALQDAFKGKKDPFAAEDKARQQKERGRGDGGGGGGGGGGGFGNFNFGEWGDGAKRWLLNTFRALAATLLFAGFICCFYLWKPLSALFTAVVRKVLRLDGHQRAHLASSQVATPDFSKTEGLGNVEESVMAKWAGADEGGTSEEEEESGEEE